MSAFVQIHHPLEANTGDYMAFLPMTTLGFSYDHRVLDGATADAFCAARLGDGGLAFGTLPADTDFAAIIERSRPHVD